MGNNFEHYKIDLLFYNDLKQNSISQIVILDFPILLAMTNYTNKKQVVKKNK